MMTNDSRSTVPTRTTLEMAFPGAMLSEIGTKESWRKEVHRPATSTHKWWAKRLGTVFRGIIVSALTPEGEDANAAYGDETRYENAVILDPFSGSGVTGVEVAKLGARPICFDINPVATLVQRQALQSWDMRALKAAYAKVQDACRTEVDRVHRTEDGRTVLYYFWVATVPCPTCGDSVRLFDSPVFSKNAYPKRVPKAQIVCPECLDVQEGRYDFAHATCANGHDITPRGTVERSSATCRQGHCFKMMNALGDEPPRYEMYAKMVAGWRGQKTYEPITDWDRALYAECEQLLTALPDDAVVPMGSLAPGNNTNQALNWNFREWRQFFNARQLYSLSLMATAIRDLAGNSAEREALCALFSGTLEFNNLFTSFKGEGTGAVRHMFSHHILKPERTPLEAHPWGTPQSSGSFSTLLSSRIQRAHEYKCEPVDLVATRSGDIGRITGISAPVKSELHQGWASFASSRGASAYVATRNAADTDVPSGSVDLVVTDPPFMDNVHYAELADFFHAWLQAMHPFDGYPDADTTRRAGEVQNADPAEFGKAIEAVWAECERVLKPGGLLAFTFHQARISGWVQVLEALHRAGFVVTAVQPVKGEMTTSIVKAGAREPSNLDSIVVCRRAADGATSPHQSVDAATSHARSELRRLMDAGIDVGAGDIRSVVRGSALAYLAATGANLADWTEQIDQLATTAIASLATTTPEAPSELSEALVTVSSTQLALSIGDAR
jgi:adenine-specific DNA methylase